MSKKIYTVNEIKKLQKKEIVQGDSVFVDEFGNTIDIDKAIEDAENEIEEKELCNCPNCLELRAKKEKSANVHLRVPYSELERCKKIASKKGLKYQTYIKSVLKQALDNDEKNLESA